jgi:hypothetical protein
MTSPVHAALSSIRFHIYAPSASAYWFSFHMNKFLSHVSIQLFLLMGFLAVPLKFSSEVVQDSSGAVTQQPPPAVP